MRRRQFLKGAALASLAVAAAPLTSLAGGGRPRLGTLDCDLGRSGTLRYAVDEHWNIDAEKCGILSPDGTYSLSLAEIRRIGDHHTLGADYTEDAPLSILVHHPQMFETEWRDTHCPPGWFYKVFAPASAKYATYHGTNVPIRPFVFRLPPGVGWLHVRDGAHEWSADRMKGWWPASESISLWTFWHTSDATRLQAREFIKRHYRETRGREVVPRWSADGGENVRWLRAHGELS